MSSVISSLLLLCIQSIDGRAVGATTVHCHSLFPTYFYTDYSSHPTDRITQNFSHQKIWVQLNKTLKKKRKK